MEKGNKRRDSEYEAHERIGEVPGYMEQREQAKVSGEPSKDLVEEGASPDIEDLRTSEGGLDGTGIALDDVGGAPQNPERRAEKKY